MGESVIFGNSEQQIQRYLFIQAHYLLVLVYVLTKNDRHRYYIQV